MKVNVSIGRDPDLQATDRAVTIRSRIPKDELPLASASPTDGVILRRR